MKYEFKTIEPKCAICSSEKKVNLYNRKKYISSDLTHFGIVRCIDCGHIYLSPRPTDETLGDYYQGKYYTAANAQSGEKKQTSHAFLYANYVKRFYKSLNCKILDVGCGDGTFIEYMAKNGANCFAVEPDKRTRDLVSNYDGVNNVWQYLSDVNENGFDVITMFEVIEHLTNPSTDLEICNKLLKENGSLIIKTPNANAFESKLLGPDWISLEIPRHLHFFTDNTINKILNQSGFEIKKIMYPTHDRALLRSIWLKLTTKGKATSNITAEYSTNSWRRKIDRTICSLLFPMWFIFSIFKASHSITVHAVKSK